MNKPLLAGLAGLVAALLAGCPHNTPVPTSGGPGGHADTFLVACASGSNCPNHAPATIYRSSTVPTGAVMVTRNGVVLYTGQAGADYTEAADAAGIVAVTFTGQPVTDGDVIQLRYFTEAGRR